MESEYLFEKKVSSSVVYQGNRIRCRNDRVELANKKIVDRDVVDHPEAVCIVALSDSNTVCLVKQYRYALEKVSIELPAGCIEPDENPLEAAKRELKEETGYLANDWTTLTSVYLAPGFCNELMHVYVAKQLHMTKQQLDEDEFVTCLEIDIDTAIKWVKSGKIDDGKTVLALNMLINQALC